MKKNGISAAFGILEVEHKITEKDIQEATIAGAVVQIRDLRKGIAWGNEGSIPDAIDEGRK